MQNSHKVRMNTANSSTFSYIRLIFKLCIHAVCCYNRGMHFLQMILIDLILHCYQYLINQIKSCLMLLREQLNYGDAKSHVFKFFIQFISFQHMEMQYKTNDWFNCLSRYDGHTSRNCNQHCPQLWVLKKREGGLGFRKKL